MGSSLIVSWFQDTFPPVLTDVNASRLRAVSWEALAQDFDW